MQPLRRYQRLTASTWAQLPPVTNSQGFDSASTSGCMIRTFIDIFISLVRTVADTYIYCQSKQSPSHISLYGTHLAQRTSPNLLVLALAGIDIDDLGKFILVSLFSIAIAPYAANRSLVLALSGIDIDDLGKFILVSLFSIAIAPYAATRQ